MADARRRRGLSKWWILVLAILGIILLFGVCGDALFDDEDERNDLGMPALIMDHECYEYGDCGYYGGGDRYDDNWGGEDRNRNRGRERGAFSPGPFDDSPIDMRNACISLDCSNRQPEEEPPPEEGEPMST